MQSLTGKLHRTNLRLSGNVLKITCMGGYIPRVLTVGEACEARARRKIADKANSLLLHCYAHPHEGWYIRFLTLTVSDTHYGSDNNYSFYAPMREFVRKIKRTTPPKYRGDIAYLCVPERGGKNGRLHLHILLYSQYYTVKQLENLWGKGWAWIERVDSKDTTSINTLSTYLTAYIGKGNGKRAIGSADVGKKRYYSSRNVKAMVTSIRCADIDAQTGVDNLLSMLIMSGLVCWTDGQVWSNAEGTISSASVSIYPGMVSQARSLIETYQPSTGQETNHRGSR
jgi:hypothetical protein